MRIDPLNLHQLLFTIVKVSKVTRLCDEELRIRISIWLALTLSVRLESWHLAVLEEGMHEMIGRR